ncbi:MAG: hypothetical protein Q8M06_07325, partial [Methanobacteriaceae archaeon]|nr:hypothetical protein [Methanobacteriaceae archaeon]
MFKSASRSGKLRINHSGRPPCMCLAYTPKSYMVSHYGFMYSSTISVAFDFTTRTKKGMRRLSFTFLFWFGNHRLSRSKTLTQNLM